MALKDKIQTMETRHAQRERELQQIIQQSHQVVSPDIAEETDKWKRLLDMKNRETEKFRTELDAILEVLKELQRQGVVLPYRGVTSSLHQR